MQFCFVIGEHIVKIFKRVAVVAAVALFAAPLFAAEKLTTQDFVEIEQLYAKYNHAIDSGDAEGWADTFTPDGVFNARFTGREALMGFIKTWKEGGGLSRRHWNSNLHVVGTAEGAKGAVYLMLWDVSAQPQKIFTTGIYEDVLVKNTGGWRFKSRVVKADRPAAPPAAAPAK